MIERIEWGQTLYAVILRAGYEPKGIEFLTPPENTLQMGVMKHGQGYQIKPHIHNSLSITNNDIQEVLHLEYGRVEVTFHDTDGNKVKSTVMQPHDTILLISGGHGFTILEDSKIIEIKQGPYGGVKDDKKRFNG